MDRKEVKDYIDLMSSKGRKISEIRKYLINNGVDQMMLDEVIDEIMFNAPSENQLSNQEQAQMGEEDKEIDNILTELSPEKLEKAQQENKKNEQISPKSKKDDKKKKENKEKKQMIRNPRKTRRRKLIINSILLIILAGAIIGISALGIEYFKYYKEKNQEELLDEANIRTNFGLKPLKEVVLQKENETILFMTEHSSADEG